MSSASGTAGRGTNAVRSALGFLKGIENVGTRAAEEFIALWKGSKLDERAGTQAHFGDLCDLLGSRSRATRIFGIDYGLKKPPLVGTPP